jgi:hypothetical protein
MRDEDFDELGRWLATMKPSLRCAFAERPEELQLVSVQRRRLRAAA